MKKGILLITAFCFVFSILLCSIAFSYEETPNFQNKEEINRNENDQMELNQLWLADYLIKYGEEHNSATALLSAAEIISNIYIQEGEEKVPEKVDFMGEPVDNVNSSSGEDTSPELENVLIAARNMQDNDAFIMAQIEKISEVNKSIMERQDFENPVVLYGNNFIDGYEKDIWTFTFSAGNRAEILVTSENKSDLDIFIYDENDNLILYDDEKYVGGYLTWYPRTEGKFKVVVENYDGEETTYNLYTKKTSENMNNE